MAEFVTVGTTDELAPGEYFAFMVDDRSMMLCRVGDVYYAIDDKCTHDDGPLDSGELIDHKIACPRHGASFDLRSGEPTWPAVQPVKTYPVRIVDDEIQVDVA